MNGDRSPGSPAGLIWWMYHHPTAPATRTTTITSTSERVGDPLDRAGLPPQPLDGAGGDCFVPRVGRPVEHVQLVERVDVVDAPGPADVAPAVLLGAPRFRPLPGQLVGDAHWCDRRASSHDCRMTAAATLSTTWRRVRPAHAGLGQRAVGGHRGEPLVVGLDGHADHASQRRDLGRGSPRRRPVAAGQAARQADDDQLGFLLAHQRGDALVIVCAGSRCAAARSAARRSCPSGR